MLSAKLEEIKKIVLPLFMQDIEKLTLAELYTHLNNTERTTLRTMTDYNDIIFNTEVKSNSMTKSTWTRNRYANKAIDLKRAMKAYHKQMDNKINYIIKKIEEKNEAAEKETPFKKQQEITQQQQEIAQQQAYKYLKYKSKYLESLNSAY